MAVSFIDGGNQSTGEKHLDLSQVTDKLHHITQYTSSWTEFELTNFNDFYMKREIQLQN